MNKPVDALVKNNPRRDRSIAKQKSNEEPLTTSGYPTQTLELGRFILKHQSMHDLSTRPSALHHQVDEYRYMQIYSLMQWNWFFVVTGCTWVTCIGDVRGPISLHQAVKRIKG